MNNINQWLYSIFFSHVHFEIVKSSHGHSINALIQLSSLKEWQDRRIVDIHHQRVAIRPLPSLAVLCDLFQ